MVLKVFLRKDLIQRIRKDNLEKYVGSSVFGGQEGGRKLEFAALHKLGSRLKVDVS